VKIALVQQDCVLGDSAANLKRAQAAVREAAASGADLIVFPELFLTGYALDQAGPDAVAGVAMPADDDRIAMVAAAAGPARAVVLGFAERDAGGRCYNSAAYCAYGRVLYTHRKICLVDYHIFAEPQLFQAGSSMRAFDTPFGRMGILICNDAWQPGLAVVAVHDGAEILLIPASSADSAFSELMDTRSTWRDITRFYASLLQCHVVFVNRVGTEPGMRFWGGSHVVDPVGRIVAEAPLHEAAITYASIDAGQARQRRNAVPLLSQLPLSVINDELTRLGRPSTHRTQ
jgi:predicted amidohydrolase